MTLGIPDQVILYNTLSMFPQSYRHYPTYPIRAVVTSIIHREVLLYLIMYQFIYSVINGFNVLQSNKKKDHFPVHIYILVHFLFTLYTVIFTYICHLSRNISLYHSVASYHHLNKIIMSSYYPYAKIIMSALSLSNKSSYHL